MKHNIVNKKILLSTLLIFVILSGCEYEAPDPIWSPEQDFGEIPVINSIDPPDSAVAGVLEIKLIGENFLPGGNDVFLSGTEVLIKSESTDMITIYRPTVVGDSLNINVRVKDSWVVAKAPPYNIKEVHREYGKFSDTELIIAIAIDSNENIYAMSQYEYIIIKTTPGGEKSTYFAVDQTNLNLKRAFQKVTDMRCGPDEYLYLSNSKNNSIYVIEPGGGEPQVFISLPQTVTRLDFDENDNLFAGGKESGLFMIHSKDTTFSNVGQYENFDIKSIKVFDGYVYIAATGEQSGIWKNEILTDSTVGDNILVFDWSDAGDFSGSAFYSITFSQDKDMYVGTDNSDPILIVHPDGTSEPLYKYILSASATHLVWGTKTYIYANSPDIRRVIRISMGKQGAPYYGRQ